MTENKGELERIRNQTESAFLIQCLVGKTNTIMV